ncbi:hypothetical protein BJ508DRAFT_365199 [Ascobolus immersus RN42]|uniref:Uncharacterized protein n=1 Tax=Ascobolus immersus RN42 TaxID=1160509 RepID=A0A3N4HWD3_ASCIM|nr:hypothetical protein BJ508DRAFT_365199 [Ascobolus immersus RN42]
MNHRGRARRGNQRPWNKPRNGNQARLPTDGNNQVGWTQPDAETQFNQRVQAVKDHLYQSHISAKKNDTENEYNHLDKAFQMCQRIINTHVSDGQESAQLETNWDMGSWMAKEDWMSNVDYKSVLEVKKLQSVVGKFMKCLLQDDESPSQPAVTATPLVQEEQLDQDSTLEAYCTDQVDVSNSPKSTVPLEHCKEDLASAPHEALPNHYQEGPAISTPHEFQTAGSAQTAAPLAPPAHYVENQTDVPSPQPPPSRIDMLLAAAARAHQQQVDYSPAQRSPHVELQHQNYANLYQNQTGFGYPAQFVDATHAQQQQMQMAHHMNNYVPEQYTQTSPSQPEQQYYPYQNFFQYPPSALAPQVASHTFQNGQFYPSGEELMFATLRGYGS